ncbi:hypothetical protein OPV22_007549 [Ensete ventricosum]|uniref:BHLH domain-containing protein n=1 Tax=Ensete ventricosum TaxID=4639 RepID=A0AAV8RRX7_ENSVE|nr:hypothetical protein OPV22_007549 [Ensete ventricosum]
MNRYVPDWTMEDDSGCLTDLLPMTNQRKPMGPDNELVELLWRNGHVVMHSQTHRRTPVGEFKQAPKPDAVQKYEQSLGDSSNLIHEAEAASWFQFPLDDSFEKELCSEFFPEITGADAVASDKISKDFVAEEEDRYLTFSSTDDGTAFTAPAPKQSTHHPQDDTMPPPRSHVMGCTPQSSSLENSNSGVLNFPHFSKQVKAADLGHRGSGSNSKAGAQESSMMTVGSSACGSNQIQAQTDPSNNISNDAADIVTGPREGTGTGTRLLSERMQSKKAHEGTVTSSSGGSGCSYGRTAQQNASNHSYKRRKARDVEESGCQSEEAEYESIDEKKQATRPTSKRRSRAAEVHNLSERRRRDRINEKMKALQELIPHCNKTDKASMLDEAIEYLKTLQLQVQMMWMGSGMASMMFPCVQQYISGMGMGIGMSHASMSAVHSAVQLPRVPFVNASVAPASSASFLPSPPIISPANFPSQMHNIHLPESYARYLGFHNFCAYGSHTVQHNQSAASPDTTLPSSAGGPTSIRNNKSAD